MGKSKREFEELRNKEAQDYEYENELNEEFRVLNPKLIHNSKKNIFNFSKPFKVVGKILVINDNSVLIELSEHHKEGIFALAGSNFKLHFELNYSFRVKKLKTGDIVGIKVVKRTEKTFDKNIKFLLNDIIKF